MEIEGFTWIVACSNTAYIFFLTVPFLSEHPDFPSRLQIFLREHTFGAILVSVEKQVSTTTEIYSGIQEHGTRPDVFWAPNPGAFTGRTLLSSLTLWMNSFCLCKLSFIHISMNVYLND